MAITGLDALMPAQVFYLEWLLDPRPSTGICTLDENSIHVSDDSESKGSATYFGQRFGISLSGMANWRRTQKFQTAYRAAVDAELRDPSYILDVIRNVRNIAMGSGGKWDGDPLKAADLYARLTGYIPPDAEEKAQPAQHLTTEQLEARVKLSAVK